jgi:hypothetical protein
MNTKLKDVYEIDLIHPMYGVDTDIEEIELSIWWGAHVTHYEQTCKFNTQILHFHFDAKLYDIQTQKWRYIDEKVTTGMMVEWDVIFNVYPDELPIKVAINKATIDFKTNTLTIN